MAGIEQREYPEPESVESRFETIYNAIPESERTQQFYHADSNEPYFLRIRKIPQISLYNEPPTRAVYLHVFYSRLTAGGEFIKGEPKEVFGLSARGPFHADRHAAVPSLVENYFDFQLDDDIVEVPLREDTDDYVAAPTGNIDRRLESVNFKRMGALVGFVSRIIKSQTLPSKHNV